MPLASLERELVGADPVAAPTTPIKDSDHSEDPNIPAIATTSLAKMQLLLLGEHLWLHHHHQQHKKFHCRVST